MDTIARNKITHSKNPEVLFSGVVSTMTQQFKGLCSNDAIKDYVRDIANHVGLPAFVTVFWDEMAQCWDADVVIDLKAFVGVA